LFGTGIFDELSIWGTLLSSALAVQDYNAGVGQRPMLPIPVALDSASPTQTLPTGTAWNHFPQPPPNSGAWGTTAQKVLGLLSDSRSAVSPSGSGPLSSVTWPYTNDAPMQASGWWIASHIECTSIPNEADLWQVPVQLGYAIALQV